AVAAQAQLTVSDLGVGGHSVTAVYSGDDQFSGSTSAAFTQTVNKDFTITQLTQNPPKEHGATTFTVTVTAQAPGAGTPTGTVTVLIDGKVKETVTLVNGSATLTVKNLCVGNHDVQVRYNGDDDFLGSNTTGLLQLVASRHHRHRRH